MRDEPTFALPEQRATNITNEGGISSSDPRITELFGLFGMSSASGVAVNEDTALGVPAIWTASNFLSGAMALLPLDLFRRVGNRREKVAGPVGRLLHDAVNDETTSFGWRKYIFERVFTGGRAFTYIERDQRGVPVNLWPLNPTCVTVRRENLRTRYEYREGATVKVYESSEIIDIPFMLRADGLGHRGPIATNKDVIGLAIAATRYGSRFFQNGGVPPFAITGNFQSAGALKRAADDLASAVKKAASEDRQALTLPSGLEIKPIGVDPEKSQLEKTQRFLVEQIARIYSLPPVFLQDLTHGTFSNTEQQDLMLVKHTLNRWVKQFEEEVNLKMFGRNDPRQRFVKLNLDGLLRGDFKTRMEGFARAIMTGQLKPDEARAMENRPAIGGAADSLFMQGATVPIEDAGESQAGSAQPMGGANDEP